MALRRLKAAYPRAVGRLHCGHVHPHAERLHCGEVHPHAERLHCGKVHPHAKNIHCGKKHPQVERLHCGKVHPLAGSLAQWPVAQWPSQARRYRGVLQRLSLERAWALAQWLAAHWPRQAAQDKEALREGPQRRPTSWQAGWLLHCWNVRLMSDSTKIIVTCRGARRRSVRL